MELQKMFNNLVWGTPSALKLKQSIEEIDGMSVKTNGNGLYINTTTRTINPDVDTVQASLKGLVWSVDPKNVTNEEGEIESIMVLGIHAAALKMPKDTSEDHITPQQLFDSGETYTQVPIIDGTNIRLFNYKDSWWMATNGSIVPNKYTSIAIDYLLEHCNLEELDDTCCYHLVLLSPHNRVVFAYTETTLYLVGITHMEYLQPVTITTSFNDAVNIRCTQPQPLTQHVIDHINDNGSPGIFVTDKLGNRFRFESETYKTMAIIKNNTPLEFRIAQLINKNNKEDFEQFALYFPEIYNEAHKRLQEISTFLSTWMRNRKIIYNPRLKSTITGLLAFMKGKTINEENTKSFIIQQDPPRIKFLLDTPLYHDNTTNSFNRDQ